MSEGTSLRLSKAAKEFNLTTTRIVEFLASKGVKIDSNPNGKIGDTEYKLLLKEFSSDKSAREEAENVNQTITKVKRETIVLDDVKAKKEKEKEIEMKEVIIKDLTIPKNETESVSATKSVDENKPSEITETKESTSGPKVLGKLDLDSMNLKTKPGKKTKEVEVVKEEKNSKNKTTKKVEEVIVEKKVEQTIQEEKPKIEEVKVEFIETKYEKLEGPKILGKVELPVELKYFATALPSPTPGGS